MINYSERIPNNVNLSENKTLQRALEQWQPSFLNWWDDMGPENSTNYEVYLRTAVSVDPKGWADFGHVKMHDYRWGIFLAPQDGQKKITFGEHKGQDVWQDVPGEYRSTLRRIIVTQGDTEPASVEQQRLLGHTAPSLYDLRNLFQVNVEEGRHLWAMVYLLHTHFGRDGRYEAEELLARRSGDADRPRILGAFNQPIENWLDFYMFTTFTDRDGKYQLLALAESGFDPLSRTCKFMLTEEAHHMFVGETGIERVIQRTVDVMAAHPGDDPRKHGVLDLPTIQKFLNLWFTLSLDLFGGEISTNAADFFASGLKGRHKEDDYDDHLALDRHYDMAVVKDGSVVNEQVPLRNAMNEVLRDAYVEDDDRCVRKWNRVFEKAGMDFRLRLPSRRFHRHIGIYSGHSFDPEGNLMDPVAWEKRRRDWLPDAADRSYVQGLMTPVYEPGKIANWVAPPRVGINKHAFNWEYVRL